jgi:arylsulfatase I/J
MVYSAMSTYIDERIGNVVKLLQTQRLYDNTLIVFTSDNGGAHNTNNYPLKGGKESPWEGGIRTASFVSGGFLPEKQRGKSTSGLVTAWDWYATFAALSGSDPTDLRAKEAGLPPVDSINVWPLISGATTSSPRQHVEISLNTFLPSLGGLIKGEYKIIVGVGSNYTVQGLYWTGPMYPNETSGSGHDTAALYRRAESCGVTPATGCMFNIFEDPGEHNNIAPKEPAIFWSLLKELKASKGEVTLRQPTALAPDQDVGFLKTTPCAQAYFKYGGFRGPYLD